MVWIWIGLDIVRSSTEERHGTYSLVIYQPAHGEREEDGEDIQPKYWLAAGTLSGEIEQGDEERQEENTEGVRNEHISYGDAYRCYVV